MDAKTLAHEERVLRAPTDVNAWQAYLDDTPKNDDEKNANDEDSLAAGGGSALTTSTSATTLSKRWMVYERAVRAIPTSYKMWYFYLAERVDRARGKRVDDAEHARTIGAFERALVTMHKMPKVWELYLRYLMSLKMVTATRRGCDRALAALPVTQHERVWIIYLDFIRAEGVPGDTARRVYRRYLKFEPGHAEEYVEFLKRKGYWGEVASKLAELVNDDSFQSLAGKSKHAMWLELCDVVTKHPNEVSGMDVDAILRGGIATFTNEVGRLWTALADYYIRRGLFEKARDVYEEGLEATNTVRDFSLIFDAYTQFEESVISAKMEAQAAEDDDDDEDEDGNDGKKKNGGEDSDDSEGIDFVLRESVEDDVDLRLARLEHLMERRPELLSSVMLRQNPHNVHEWEKRIALFEGNPMKQIVTFTDAVKTVNPELATGRVCNLWIDFAKFYETHGDLASARTVFERATTSGEFKTVDDLATVWCESAEMELRHKNYDEALETMRRATTPREGYREPTTPEQYDALPVRDKVYKSTKLWSFYCDLEESLGSLDSAKKVYDKMIALRVATPQVILNYAHLLQENNFFEDSFQVYERGVNAFKFPYSREIWSAYLTQFVARFKGTKLERARDLFEQVLDAAPPKESKPFYLAYAKLEEEYGLGKRAMEVYNRAVSSGGVPVSERLSVYDVYVPRAMEFFGVGKVRDVFSAAADDAELPNDVTKELTIRFAEFERKLGELDRARALYVHASQFSNPVQDADFWSTWHEFEVRHGNEDTFREMLRIKRAVAASFSDMHFNTSTIVNVQTEPKPETQGAAEVDDAMARLDAAHEAHAAQKAATTVPGFVRSHVEGASAGGSGGDAGGNDDAEIDLDDIGVPSAVFGGVKRDADSREQSDAKRARAE